MWYDHAYWETWHSQNSSFKYFQGYVDIFRDTDAYLATLTGAELEGSGEAFPSLFEKCPDVENKTLYAPFFEFNFPFKMSKWYGILEIL